MFAMEQLKAVRISTGIFILSKYCILCAGKLKINEEHIQHNAVCTFQTVVWFAQVL
jgi:hypothetical protein